MAAKKPAPKSKAPKNAKKRGTGKNVDRQIKLIKATKKQMQQGELPDIKRAMIAAGYSVSYVKRFAHEKNGNQVIADILDKVFPDKELATLQLRQLSASKIKTLEFPSGTDTADVRLACEELGFRVLRLGVGFMGKIYCIAAVPDWEAINKGLERVWKLKKHLGDGGEGGGGQPSLTVLQIFQNLSDRNQKYANPPQITPPPTNGE